MTADHLLADLDRDGIVLIPELLAGETLRAAQRAFEARLQSLRWNDVDGYEKTERYRHMVQDVLTLEQGFVDAALDSRVTAVLRAYIGPTFELVEAKGWKSLPTTKDFHGWHGDAWYDQSQVAGIPREVKLALYLTDVRSGAFQYLRGTHRRQAPRPVREEEVRQYPSDRIVTATGPAGTGILFDTTGIHRQQVPILEPRWAVFYNYHDPTVPLQREDLEYYRYHPLLLNAAFLGNLGEDERRILGFGNKRNYLPAFQRQGADPGFQKALHATFDARLLAREFSARVLGRVKRLMGARR